MVIVTTGNASCLNSFDFPTGDSFEVNPQSHNLWVKDSRGQGVAVFSAGNWIFAEVRANVRTAS